MTASDKTAQWRVLLQVTWTWTGDPNSSSQASGTSSWQYKLQAICSGLDYTKYYRAPLNYTYLGAHLDSNTVCSICVLVICLFIWLTPRTKQRNRPLHTILSFYTPFLSLKTKAWQYDNISMLCSCLGMMFLEFWSIRIWNHITLAAWLYLFNFVQKSNIFTYKFNPRIFDICSFSLKLQMFQLSKWGTIRKEVIYIYVFWEMSFGAYNYTNAKVNSLPVVWFFPPIPYNTE